MITFDNDGDWKKTVRNIVEMSRISIHLWPILKSLYEELKFEGYPFRITAVFYPRGAHGSTSMTHPEFRAVDIGAKDAAGAEMGDDLGGIIQSRVNRQNKFGIEMKACYFHGAPGHKHFHCQVPKDMSFEEITAKSGAIV